jgi:hypothetical protein
LTLRGIRKSRSNFRSQTANGNWVGNGGSGGRGGHKVVVEVDDDDILVLSFGASIRRRTSPCLNLTSFCRKFGCKKKYQKLKIKLKLKLTFPLTFFGSSVISIHNREVPGTPLFFFRKESPHTQHNKLD